MLDFLKKHLFTNKNLFKSVIKVLRSTLDIQIIKQKIVDDVGKSFNVDRCFIIEYEKNNNKFLEINEEYLGTNKIKTLQNEDFNLLNPTIINELKNGKTMLLKESQIIFESKHFDLENEQFKNEQKLFKEYNIVSAIAFPLICFNDFVGIFIISYTKEIGASEINLLKDITELVAIAIYKSNMYKLVNKNAQRETILRQIIEEIRTTITLHETKQIIVKTVGKTLGADRCFITEYDQDINRFLLIKDEYRSSEDILSVIGLDVHEIVPGFIEALKKW